MSVADAATEDADKALLLYNLVCCCVRLRSACAMVCGRLNQRVVVVVVVVVVVMVVVVVVVVVVCVCVCV